MAPADETGQALERATATFEAIRTPRLYARDRKLFGTRPWWLLGRHYKDLWPFTDTWSALCTLGSLLGRSDARDMLEGMLEGLRAHGSTSGLLETTGETGFESVVTSPLGAVGDRFFDDNAWMGLALISHYELTGSAELLAAGIGDPDAELRARHRGEQHSRPHAWHATSSSCAPCRTLPTTTSSGSLAEPSPQVWKESIRASTCPEFLWLPPRRGAGMGPDLRPNQI